MSSDNRSSISPSGLENTHRKHYEVVHEYMFIMYCKYSTGCSNLAFTNGREKLGIIMRVLQLSSPCNYRAVPVLNSDKGGPLNQH